jgi:alpha-tubulin suppressor-like RCC1 family protein
MKTSRAILIALGWVFASASHAMLTELTGIVDIKAGSIACALTNAGGVKCWGNGIIGDGQEFGQRTTAGDVIGLTSGVSAIGVGRGGQVCAAMAAGGIKCMGGNFYGEVGDGTTTRRSLPADVVGISGLVTAIAGGSKHTCAVVASGGVKCWGANDVGQLGIGSIGGSFPTPQDVVGLDGSAVAIAAGPVHTCVILSGGGAKCWGSNASGELGDGTTMTRATPVAVNGVPSDLVSIAAGGGEYSYNTGTTNGYVSHSCVVTAGGGAKCWGRNDSGNLGDGTGNAHLTAFDVSGLVTGTGSITAGGSSINVAYGCCVSTNPLAHSCAVTASGGAKCWGNNTYGELGTGSSGTDSSTPIDVAGLTSGVGTVAAGKGFSCALTSDTKVKCWGDSDRLGYSSAPGTSRPPRGVPTAIMTGTLPQSIQVTGYSSQVNIGGTGGVSATGSSYIPVTFTSLTPSVCSVGASSGNSNPFVQFGWNWYAEVTGLASGLCYLVANEAGDGYYDPAPSVNYSPFRVGDPVAQTITFGAAPSVPVGGYGSLVATASSGLVPVTFQSNTPSICSVSGNIVTGVTLGSCTIAGRQNGDLLYAAAEGTMTFAITANTGTHGLIVTTFGTGHGTVSSVPSGIDCGDICAGNFSTSVTLTATAAAGSKFAGWGGTACDRTTAPCTLAMSADTFLGAMFVIDSPIARLGNISTRGLASVNDPLIAGFVIGGNTPKTVVITAAGPSLNAYGIDNALSNPNLTLVRSSDNAVIATNDNWGSASNAGQISATGLAPNNALESAIVATLAPGAYTAIVRGAASEGVGIALAGVFEADHPEIPLANLSTRGVVATGNNVMIAGFIVQGNDPQTVVVNVAGPYLANFGITNPLANPKLTIVRSADNAVIATNDDWQSQTNPADVSAIQATGFQPNDPAEPALKLTLPPGAYTAIVEGVGGTIGTAVVGVFAVP